MANFIKGNSLMLFNSSGTSYAFATNHTLTVSTETSETSSKDHGMFGAVEITKYNWEVSSENLYTVDDFGSLFDDYISGNSVTLKFGVKQQTANDKTVVDGDYTAWSNGTEYYEGSAYITNLSANAQNGEVATYSVTFTGIGKLKHVKTGTAGPDTKKTS